MAYLLDFPPSTLPDDIRAPPYVIFGIKGLSVVQHLPPRIPLNTVLHFAPALRRWVLPAPENLPPAVAKGVLRTPQVGIDIGLDIGVASLQRIIFKMMQAAGFAVPKNVFQHQPSLITSISIHRTWLMLELPRAGLDGLLIHMQTRLMMGPPVSFTEMRELWNEFPATHDIVRLMAVNFVQSHIALFYSRETFEAIRQWCLSCPKLNEVFTAAENRFTEFGKMPAGHGYSNQDLINTKPSEVRRKAREQSRMAAADMEAKLKSAEMADLKKANKALKKMSTEDIKKRQDETTIRKSTKWKSAPDLKDKFDLDDMSLKLTEALLKVKKERETEAEAESKDDGETEEYLQPTVYNPSGKPT